MNRIRRTFALLAPLLLACTFPLAASDTTSAFPVEVLPIAFSPDGLSDTGGERLRAELANAQFVAVGESHGFADVPEFGLALARDLRRIDPRLHHAVEIGPFSARWLARRLQSAPGDGGLDAVARGLAGTRLSMPFTSYVEDARLAAGFPDVDGAPRLWGIDQEFVGAAALLAQDVGDAPASAPQAPVALGDVWLPTATPADFQALSARYHDDAAAGAVIDALSESAGIYRFNVAGASGASNEARGALMRRYFLDAYRAAGPAPRVLLKMGANHLGRGTTATGIYDLGSLLPGLAAANGMTSLHVAFMPMAGQMRSLDPTQEHATVVVPHKDTSIAPLLAAAGIDEGRIGATGYVLIPLTNLRYRLTVKQRATLPAGSRFLLEGFDYLVTTRDAHAATHFEAWTR
ncbi:hypothetical protein [Xanthomonas sp. XNM01]|uniref:hypothetical protein n=1 Tax=Xanthomonas sp. XNM01 TaxID=2769289 RepID=UPI00177F144E|nr:hypothetical protein [Xanthomonas sp. XNM01]MBD9367508.1 hypothetical protein [Xanthomonas sp. XNM01]